MLAKPSWELSPGWSMPWGYPLCQGNFGSAQGRLQGMTSMRHMYHINKRRGLQSNCTEDMTQVQKAHWWHCGWHWHRVQRWAQGPSFTRWHRVCLAFISPISFSQFDLCVGLYGGQGRTAALERLPIPSRTLPGLCPAQPAQLLPELASVGLWGEQSPAQTRPSVAVWVWSA